MNQRFIAPGLTSIVGATLAVALVNALAVALLKYESGLERTGNDKQVPARV